MNSHIPKRNFSKTMNSPYFQTKHSHEESQEAQFIKKFNLFLKKFKNKGGK